MKVKSLSDFKDGFFINVKNSLEDIRYFNSDILSREIVYDENYCICFSECQDSIDKTSCIVTYGNHRGVNLQLLDYEVTVKKNFDYLKCVSGDFIFVSISKLKIIIFNSLESQCELFWIFHNSVLKASPYHHFINSNIDDRALAVLCYGESINPFADIKILRRGQLLILEKNHPVVIKSIEQKMFDTKQLQKYSLPELSDIAYGLLKKSVQKKIDSTSKIGLLLSGGIDSAAIARVLYDLDLNATFITWTSKNKRADEGKYTEKLSNYLGYDNIKINVDSEVGLLPKTTAKVFPYTHAVSSWWDAACEIAQDNGIDTLISGHYAAVFDGTFSLREYSHFKDRLKGAMNSYANPLFRGNLFVSHKGLLEKNTMKIMYLEKLIFSQKMLKKQYLII